MGWLAVTEAHLQSRWTA